MKGTRTHGVRPNSCRRSRQTSTAATACIAVDAATKAGMLNGAARVSNQVRAWPPGMRWPKWGRNRKSGDHSEWVEAWTTKM